MFFKKKHPRDHLVGVWKHTDFGYGADLIVDGRMTSTRVYITDVITFNWNGTFSRTEEGVRHPFRETGTWVLSQDGNYVTLTYSSGEIIQLDIRNFNGRTFTTSSCLGNDLVYTKV